MLARPSGNVDSTKESYRRAGRPVLIESSTNEELTLVFEAGGLNLRVARQPLADISGSLRVRGSKDLPHCS